MKQRTILVLVAVVLVGASLFLAWQLAAPAQVSDANTETFARANQLYRNGNYPAAAKMYEQLVTGGVENADLFYNLGVTYAAMGNAGRSEEMFAVARAFAPRDPQVAQTGNIGLPLTQNETALLVLAGAGVITVLFVLLRSRMLSKNTATV